MLKLEKIKKSYSQPDDSQVPILDIPDFSLDAGEQVVLIGPSGCGKTTMLHTIAGITNPDSGKVFVGGIELTRFSEAARDRVRADKIGYVFQTFNLLQGFSAYENVLLGMSFAKGKASPTRAKQLLEKIGLGHRLNNKPHQLSVGEQQRVAIARALANRPALLLADEPTANVDPGNQSQIIDLITESCRDENVALLMVTHSMEVANRFNRVVRLEELNLVVNQARTAAAEK